MARTRRNCLLTAPIMALLVAPAHPDRAAPPELSWAEPVTVATGNAHRGPWRMNRSDFDFVDDPTVTLLPRGEAAVAWVDQSRKDVYFQRYDAKGEAVGSQPANISATPEVFSWLPRMAVAPGEPQTLYVLWQEIVFSGGTHGGEAFFARSTDGGRTFSEPLNLSRSQAGDGKGRLTPRLWHNGSLDLAVGPNGTVYVAWTEYEGRLHFARSTDRGTSFTDPQRVTGGPDQFPARGPALAVGGDGTVHLAWTVGGDRDANIHYTHAQDGQHFGEPRQVAPGPGHADAPKLAVDANATVHLVYGNSPSGPLKRYDVRYTRRAADAKHFEAPRKLSAPLPEGFVGASFPHLAAAGDGRLYVVCELFAGRGRVHPTGLALMRSDNSGDTFTPPTLVPGTADPADGHNGSTQGLLMDKLDADAHGAMAIVNSKFKRGEFSRIRLMRAEPAE